MLSELFSTKKFTEQRTIIFGTRHGTGIGRKDIGLSRGSLVGSILMDFEQVSSLNNVIVSGINSLSDLSSSQ